MILVLFIVCVLMHCVLVIAASVFDADFPDQADYCLVMMMGKHGGEYDHQHRHQGRDYRDSLHHDKNRKITRKCEILRRKVILHIIRIITQLRSSLRQIISFEAASVSTSTPVW